MYMTVVRHEASHLLSPPTATLFLTNPMNLASSSCLEFPSQLSQSNPTHTPLFHAPFPPPHQLAGAHRRGPVESQGSVGNRQTVFSRNCQKVVACFQAHPPGTCNHDMVYSSTCLCRPRSTDSIHPGKHPLVHLQT
jgi:hypothetical protein